MGDPWYRDGLRFSCTQCGHCCTGAPGYVWVTLKEIRALAKSLDISVPEFAKRYLRKVKARQSLTEKLNGECVFWDKGCTVYAARPRQCRTYPFWSDVLRSSRTWEAESDECPGIDRGRLYSVDEIRVIRRGEGEASAKRRRRDPPDS